MDITVLSAHSPIMNADGSITLMVKFEHLNKEVPFTASKNDIEPHGVLIHKRALAGEFGKVTPHKPLSAMDIANKESPIKRNVGLEMALKKIQHWEIMGDETKLGVWKKYYRDLYNLASNAGWPMVKAWPIEPKD